VSKYQNGQKWCECSLVAMWNAARYFGLSAPKIGTREYYDRCRATGKFTLKNGIVNEKRFNRWFDGWEFYEELERLGLNFKLMRYNFRGLSTNLPFDITIYPCKSTYNGNGLAWSHTVLAVDVNRRDRKFLLANYDKTKMCWLSWDFIKRRKDDRFPPKSYSSRVVHSLY